MKQNMECHTPKTGSEFGQEFGKSTKKTYF